MEEKQIDEMVERYTKGYETVRSIGKALGTSHVTVCKCLDRRGIPRRNGSARRGILVKDLYGRRFGKLRVLGREGESYPVRWRVLCDCGKTKVYSRQQLLSRRSCGCAPRGPLQRKRAK